MIMRGHVPHLDLILGAHGINDVYFSIHQQQTKETYHITFDESPDAIKFLKPSVDNINIAENERYPPDEYLHPYEPSKRYQTNSNDVSFIEPCELPELVVLETKVSSDQNGQNDQSVQNDKILNDDHSEHSNHTSDEQIDNLPNTEDIQISKHSSSLRVDDTSDKHIELFNIIGNLGAGMLTRAMAKELSVASVHECLFVDFLSKEEPKKVSEALKHPRWVDAMQDELNQFARNKIKQSEKGISINQEKYVKDLLKKYDINGSSMKTLMVSPNNLGPDLRGKAVNETQYRANPKEPHLIAVKRIFRYLKGTSSLGLWYPKCLGFDLKGYLDSDYAGCNMDRKSTSGAC
ncbi:hypothetical protein Tco_1337407 [Tanacetum coccineum]